MSAKLFAVFLYAGAVLIFAAAAYLADNFKTVGDRLSWFVVVSGVMLGVIRFMFVLFSYGRHRDE